MQLRAEGVQPWADISCREHRLRVEHPAVLDPGNPNALWTFYSEQSSVADIYGAGYGIWRLSSSGGYVVDGANALLVSICASPC